jgi:uncharacterized membrane protein YeaQ/YmgE (transglycosylase-associated protein family)
MEGKASEAYTVRSLRSGSFGLLLGRSRNLPGLAPVLVLMSHPIIWWILVGGAAGILAKAILPGDKSEPKGCIVTILLGIAGSLAMGFIVHDLLHSSHFGNILDSIIGATIGALLLIWVARRFEKSS